MRVLGIAAAACVMAGLARGAEPEKIMMEPVGSGMMHRLGGYIPGAVEMGEKPPATLRVPPKGLVAPVYGVLTIGSGELHRTFHVILDRDGVEGPWPRLYVDANGNGDMTDDGPVEWRATPAKGEDGRMYDDYIGGARLDLGPAGRPFLARVGVYNFDPRMPGLPPGQGRLLGYYRDYGREGKASFGGQVLPVVLNDLFTTGDFSGKTKPAAPHGANPPIYLFVDRNGNGKVDGDGEQFDAGKPFTINGVTYEVRDVTPTGDSFELARSSATVPEIPVPADVTVGKPLAAFDATTMDGRGLHVPGDFKGKVLLIDFWATWCGVCMAEMPNIADVYGRYHDKGLEVLGVSVDEATDRAKVDETVKANHMDWPQVFDAGQAGTKLAVKYGVSSYPTTILIDGDTGVVLALHSLREENLGPTVEKALAAKRAGP